jgi:hypothetical protein
MWRLAQGDGLSGCISMREVSLLVPRDQCGKTSRVDHRFKDGDTTRVGPIALTTHVTGGSTRLHLMVVPRPRR